MSPTARLALAGLMLLTVSCAQPLSRVQAVTWLDAKTEAPDLQVAGPWESVLPFMSGGWGYANWIQTGAEVRGELGLYSVQGRVAGKTLYLVLSSGHRVAYTAILKPTATGGLSGVAVGRALADAVPPGPSDQAPLDLVRRAAAKP